MARIAGVNIPTAKRIEVALTYIFGIGKKTAQDICAKSGIDCSRRVHELSEEEVAKIREVIDSNYLVKVCRFADRARRRMPVPVKVNAKPLRTRRSKR